MRRRHLVLLTALAAAALPTPAGAAGLGLGRCDESGLRKSGFRCASVTVPKDYANPAGGTLRVAVTVRRATARRGKLGPLFVNFGGPGGESVSGLDGFLRLLPREVRRRFDVVGMDPRGVGGSRPALGCRVDQRKVGLYSLPTPRPQSDLAAYATRVQTYVDRCAARNADVAPYVGTANVARDMDTVRARLGAGKLTYLGFSYGTVLGATYAHLFPDRYRAAVLDGAVDVGQWYTSPHDGLLAQTAGFETALDRFLAAIAKAPRYARWARGQDPRTAFDALVAKANAKPLPSRTKGDRDGVGGDEILNATTGLLYSKSLWPALSKMLDGVRAGNGRDARFWSDQQLGGRRKDGTYGPSLDRYFMISAADQPYADDPQTSLTWGAEATARFPHFSANVGYTEAHYGRWPFEGVGVDRGPFTLAPTAPELLVVGTTFDPATPYQAAVDTTAQLGRARLLTVDGDGHTAFRNGSACADRAIAQHLLRGRLPAAGTRCRQRLPFPPRKASARAAAHVVAWR